MQTMSEQTQRILTATALLLVLVPLIGLAPSLIVGALFALLFIPATWEWGRLIDPEHRFSALYSLLICWLSVFFYLLSIPSSDIKIFLYLIVIWWFIALVISTIYQVELCQKSGFRWFLRIHILVALTGCWLAVYQLHQSSWLWLLYVIALVTISDTAAYYTGQRLGKHKLSPAISPGKTLEGLLAALLAVFILSIGIAMVLLEQASLMEKVSFVALSLVACLAGVIGDLTESMAKRCANVKNSGNLLAGHGGLLDRIDAFLAAAPVFALGLLYL